MSTKIDRDEVARIAALAHLELDEATLERMTHELGGILGYMAQLQEVDVEGVAPTAHVELDRLPLREDVVVASLSHDEALREAPSTAIEGFAVPAFVDEG
jgi:aspartyl-tRNA(Asn)/glutamyl-tRNA(Gln) amidotransferase subunit C